MRSLWLLRELGLEFELEEMPFDMKVLRGADYLSLHPLGRVPCLVDGDRVIFESGAICQYLCERYDDGRLGRGPDHPEHFEWIQWVHFAETVGVLCAALIQQQVFMLPEDRSPALIKLETRRLEKALEVLNAELSEREYLLPSGFSAVDTSVGYSVHMAARFVSLDRVPGVRAYYERLRARPAFQSSLPDEPSEIARALEPE